MRDGLKADGVEARRRPLAGHDVLSVPYMSPENSVLDSTLPERDDCSCREFFNCVTDVDLVGGELGNFSIPRKWMT